MFLEQLDDLIAAKHLLKHPFYQAWTRGELSKECLQEYAKEYYHHVSAFPMYLSALHAHTEDSETRKALLKNLVEEEGGSPNHPGLWKMFAKALGVRDCEIEKHQPCLEIQQLISTFKENCSEGSVGQGLASLYAYESQIPEICISKIEGLKKHYGMKNPKDWEYFRVHIQADKEHAADERKLLARHLEHPREIIAAANRILDGLWSFLTALCHRYNLSCQS